MRVAYVCMDPGIPVWGNKGCSIHVQGILRALLRKGIDVELIALRPGGTCPPGLESVTLHTLHGELAREGRERAQALYRLNDTVRQLLGAHGCFDFVYERYALYSYAGVEFARSHDIPGLLEVNAPLIEEQERYRVLFDRDGATEATKRAFHAATAVVAVSEGIAAYVRNHGVVDGRISVLPNAVDPREFSSPRISDATQDGTFTIGFVGSLKPWHGVDQLISAYARLWDYEAAWQLLIAGDGPERDRLQARVAGLPAPIASSIKFLGMLPHAEIPRLLATMNAAVAPSVSSDTYFSPIKIFEYMSAGRPVVAARCGQIPSLIRHGVTGLLYDPEDTQDLASALLRLRADPSLAALIAEGARRDVLAHHSWDHRCDSIMRIVRRSARSHAHMAS